MLDTVILNDEICKKFGFTGDAWKRIQISKGTYLLLGKTDSPDGLPYHAAIEQTLEDGFTIAEAADIQKNDNIADDDAFILKGKRTVFIRTLRRVSELENLYFALTGKKLFI